MRDTKHKTNLENWRWIRNLTKDEYKKFKLSRNTRGWYKCLHCGEKRIILNGNFKLNKITCECIKRKEVDNATGIWRANLNNWEVVQYIAREERVSLGLHAGISCSRYKCKTCGELKIIRNQSFKRHKAYCDNGCHGRSSIAVVRPDLVKYFVNKEDAYSLRTQSNKQVALQCPVCKHSKKMYVGNFTRHGFSCPVCSDGYSFPEKVVSNVLKQLGVDFQAQLTSTTFKWCGRRRYDFYIPSLNCIIEAHGKQHYVGTGWKTREHEKENDIDKWMLAQLKLGVGLKYVILDCRESRLDFIKQNIMSSQLSNLFDLSIIDWGEVGEQSEVNIMLEVVNYYNQTHTSTVEIAKVFNITYKTVGDYLKRGAAIGLCNYCGKEVKEKIKTKVVGIHLKTKEVVKFDSQAEAALRLNTSQSNISICCRGLMTAVKGYMWLYESDYAKKTPSEIEELVKQTSAKYRPSAPKSVVGECVTTGETIRFGSMQEAEHVGFKATKICAVAQGKRRTHKGYKWYYEEDYLKTQEQSNIA